MLIDYVYKCNKKTAHKTYWICTYKECKKYTHTNLNDGYLCGGIEPRDHESNPGMLTARNTRNNTT